MLYRKLLKVTFADGSEIKPEPLEYMIYDGDHIILVNEENMSAKIIETEEQHFEINISHYSDKCPDLLEQSEKLLLNNFLFLKDKDFSVRIDKYHTIEHQKYEWLRYPPN